MAQHATWNQTVKFSVGDQIRVHQRLLEDEEGKERIQVFEGMVIAINGKEERKSFTVRKVGANYVGVERIWPLTSPWIKDIELKNAGSVRRSKLYYTRSKTRRGLRKITMNTKSDKSTA